MGFPFIVRLTSDRNDLRTLIFLFASDQNRIDSNKERKREREKERKREREKERKREREKEREEDLLSVIKFDPRSRILRRGEFMSSIGIVRREL